MQGFAAESARLARRQQQIDNAEKMRRLNAKLEAGELDAVDPVRRWWYGLAEGERHGDRERALLDRQLARFAEEDESDPRVILARLKVMHEGPQ